MPSLTGDPVLNASAHPQTVSSLGLAAALGGFVVYLSIHHAKIKRVRCYSLPAGPQLT
jgi:hypothetical protein